MKFKNWTLMILSVAILALLGFGLSSCDSSGSGNSSKNYTGIVIGGGTANFTLIGNNLKYSEESIDVNKISLKINPYIYKNLDTEDYDFLSNTLGLVNINNKIMIGFNNINLSFLNYPIDNDYTYLNNTFNTVKIHIQSYYDDENEQLIRVWKKGKEQGSWELRNNYIALYDDRGYHKYNAILKEDGSILISSVDEDKFGVGMLSNTATNKNDLVGKTVKYWYNDVFYNYFGEMKITGTDDKGNLVGKFTQYSSISIQPPTLPDKGKIKISLENNNYGTLTFIPSTGITKTFKTIFNTMGGYFIGINKANILNPPYVAIIGTFD